MSWKDRLASRRLHLRGLGTRHYVMMFFGVFLMIAPVMTLAVSGFTPARPPATYLAWFGVSGLLAVIWAASMMLDKRLIVLCAILQIGAIVAFANQWPPGFAIGVPSISFEGYLTMGCIAGSYVLLIRSMRVQGRMRARAQAELDIAAKIHESLVPRVSLRNAGVEVLGQSRASSEMGGDLIDVLTRADEIDALVADVSGHGVGAGIVMGMVKSSARTLLRSRPELGVFLGELNAVLADLTRPDMFATMACVRVGEGASIEYALAGHLPILLRAKDGTVRDLANDNLPLGVEAGEVYRSGTATLATGDTLVLLTDGLTEVQDAQGRELGLATVRRAVQQHGGAALTELFRAIVAAADAHGTQSDDQTVLLIRRT